MTIAIVIARGGSKRLPRKNMKLFCGIPLVAWALIQAKNSVLIDKVVLSTDDDELAETGKKYGAEIIRRPDWPDADQVAANRPFIHAMTELKKQYGKSFDTVLTILPTTPLVLPGEFDQGIMAYRRYGVDVIRPLRPLREIVVLKKTHPFRARTDVFAKHYEYLGEANGWIVTSPNYYLEYNSLFTDLDADLDKMENWPGRECYFIPAQYWQYADVDTAEEFEFAELVMEHYILKGQGQKVYEDYFKNTYHYDGMMWKYSETQTTSGGNE